MLRWMGFITLMLAGGLCASAVAAAEQWLTVTSRDGVAVPILLLEPTSKPRGVLLFYPGGKGSLDLNGPWERPTINKLHNNFLVRSRQHWADRGFVVAIADKPDDRNKLSFGYRLGNKQQQDGQALINHLQQRYPLPLWLVGTSAGSISAANLATSATGVDGLILTASVTGTPEHYRIYQDYPLATASLPLAKVTMPVLVLSHQLDQCERSPPRDGRLLSDKLINAAAVELELLPGGGTMEGNPCKGQSYHGFWQSEVAAVTLATDFIRRHSEKG